MTVIQSQVSLRTTLITTIAPNFPQYPAGSMGLVNNTPTHEEKGILRIKLTEDLPPNIHIISCKLHFHVTIGFTGRTITAHDITTTGINIAEATWNNKASFTPWTAPGAIGDYNPTPFTTAPGDNATWQSIDITSQAQDSYISGIEKHILLWKQAIEANQISIASESYGTPSLRPYLEIEYLTYICDGNLSSLGKFQLGCMNLGAQVGQMSVFDNISISDDTVIDIEALLEDGFTISDLHDIKTELEVFDTITFFENIWYPAFFQAGIQGRIVNQIDITSENFCENVLQTGQSMELNDVPERAFLQVKQSVQRFDNEIQIFPGDAIMYTCPALAINVGDTVLHNFIEYTIYTWIDRFFGGNMIFRKVALRRKELFNLPMPQVTGLVASPNLEGKSTLTWDEVDKDLYPSFDHFNVYRSLSSGGPYDLVDSTKSNRFSDKNLVPNTPYYYVVAAVDKYGHEGTASAEAVTGTDTTKPSTPIGGR